MSDNKREKKSTISVSFRMDTALRKAVGEYLAKINQGIYLGTEKLTMKEIVEESLRAEMEGRIQKSTKGTSLERGTKDFSGEPKNSLAPEHVSGNTMDAIRAALEEISANVKETRNAVLADIAGSVSRKRDKHSPEGRNSAQNPSRISAADNEASAAELKQRLKDAQQNNARTRKSADKRRQSA